MLLMMRAFCLLALIELYLSNLGKVRTNWHRHDYSDPLADEKKVQAGTHVFIQELKNRPFRR